MGERTILAVVLMACAILALVLWTALEERANNHLTEICKTESCHGS